MTLVKIKLSSDWAHMSFTIYICASTWPLFHLSGSTAPYGASSSRLHVKAVAVLWDKLYFPSWHILSPYMHNMAVLETAEVCIKHMCSASRLFCCSLPQFGLIFFLSDKNTIPTQSRNPIKIKFTADLIIRGGDAITQVTSFHNGIFLT